MQLKSRVHRASHSVKCKLVYLARSLLITLWGNPWGSQPISREITVRHTHDLHHGSVPFIKADVEIFPFSKKKKKRQLQQGWNWGKHRAPGCDGSHHEECAGPFRDNRSLTSPRNTASTGTESNPSLFPPNHRCVCVNAGSRSCAHTLSCCFSHNYLPGERLCYASALAVFGAVVLRKHFPKG